jgi:acetoin utilization protein AcuB
MSGYTVVRSLRLQGRFEKEVQMRIKHYMTKDPVTVSPDTLVIDAQKVMREKKIRHLPVVEKGKVVGMITFRNLIEAAPSSATSLSIHEINYLLMRMKVKDLMKKNVITVSPEDYITDVIALGMRANISGFPVVDGHGVLIGIVTDTSIAQSMLQLFGTNAKEEMVHLKNVDIQAGTIGKIVSIVEKAGATIISVITTAKQPSDPKRLYVRIKPDGKAKVEAELKKAGYEIED